MIRSLTTSGHLFEIRPKYVRQIVPSFGLTVLITDSGARFILTDELKDILRQAEKDFRWDSQSQTFVRAR